MTSPQNVKWLQLLMRKRAPQVPALPCVPPRLREVVNACLDLDPSRRPSAADVVEVGSA
jgi:hypothetical protein